MSKGHFDVEAFYEALDNVRKNEKLTWKKIADNSRISASTLTRMAQGKRPDVDSMAALAAWSNLNIDNYIVGRNQARTTQNSIEEVSALFRADSSLSPDAAEAIEAIVRAAHEKLRRE
ncbi:MAG: hypothetical protein P1U54_00255 [Immundisolibacteraceae bacterium]|nr:hypothetical protein [Immundisolibacteraceae bacterium]